MVALMGPYLRTRIRAKVPGFDSKVIIDKEWRKDSNRFVSMIYACTCSIDSLMNSHMTMLSLIRRVKGQALCSQPDVAGENINFLLHLLPLCQSSIREWSSGDDRAQSEMRKAFKYGSNACREYQALANTLGRAVSEQSLNQKKGFTESARLCADSMYVTSTPRYDCLKTQYFLPCMPVQTIVCQKGIMPFWQTDPLPSKSNSEVNYLPSLCIEICLD